MTTPTQALHAACLAFERATGREITQGIVERAGDLYITGHDPYIDRSVSARNDEAAHDILEARAWRAVREWGIQNFGFHITRNTIVISRDEPDGSFNLLYAGNSLTSAADAISEFVEKQKAAKLPQ